ncbi:MAG: ergothioneine biosynthesis protein EgtB [Candidatus Velthaea sp.]
MNAGTGAWSGAVLGKAINVDTLTPSNIDRGAMISWYRANRRRSKTLFGLIDPNVMYDAPIPLRHPFIFYEGHLPAFTYITLLRGALGRPSLDRRLEDLFNRGIDPHSIDDAQAQRRNDWPDRATVAEFGRAVDAAVEDALENAVLEDETNPQLVRGQAAWNILEHEEMHHETMLYIVHRLPDERKRIPATEIVDRMPAKCDPKAIPAGRATLGVRRDAIRFAWDNEFDEHSVDVGAFGVDVYDVTNGEYLDFVRDGGPPPPFWLERDGEWYLRAFGATIPLPLSWPVYASNAQADAFARWSGARLMTEAEYHRAAFGTPSGTERPHPWGDAAPGAAHGNFNFRRYDPEPVGSSPLGASAWGVHDLVGNGWEWTSTPFAPFPGFEPMASYLPYSADFFDNDHYIIKGASPITSSSFVRRSFRNWYRREYPYMYATFRRAWD